MSVVDNQKPNNNSPPQSSTGGPNGSDGTQMDNKRGYFKGGQRKGNKGRFNRSDRSSSVFKGETSGVNGNVFQLQEESKDPGQFKKTLNAIERFANKTYECDLRKLFDKMEIPTIEKPKEPIGDDVDEVDKQVYHEEIKQFVKEKRQLRKAMRAMFAVIWGQCSPNVVTKLTQLPKIDDWKEDGECAELLLAIQSILMKYEHQKHALVTLFRQMRFFYSYRQRDHQDLHKYFEVFGIMVDNIDHIGGSFVHPKFHEDLMKKDGIEDAEKEDEEMIEKYNEKAKEKFLAIAFLMGGRQDVYGDLIIDLENDFLKGKDSFPDSVTDSYHLMANYGLKRRGTQTNRNKFEHRSGSHQGLGFMQNAAKKHDLAAGTDGIVHERITCFRCQKKGHYSDKCPMSMLQCAPAPPQDVTNERASTDTDELSDNVLSFGFLQTGFTMTQNSEGRYKGLNKNWILLDTQSNIDIFCNRRLLTNIRKVSDGNHLELRSNGGSMVVQMVGDVRGYGTVWFHPDSLANILSFANVRKKFNVHMSTGPKDPNPSIIVDKRNGDVMEFKEFDVGLYVHDANKRNDNHLLKSSYDYVFVTTTVAQLENEFTSREVEEARQANRLYVQLGRPSKQIFLKLLDENFIRDCPITKDHAKRAWYIYGHDLGNLKGKTTRATPTHARNHMLIPVPHHIKYWHNTVTLCIDIFFLQNIPYFHTISRNLKFRTVEFLPSRKYKHILQSLQNVFDLYESRGFPVLHVHGDPEFQSLSGSFRPTQFYIVGKNDHVPEIERSIRTLKERFRSSVHGLPYVYYTKLMVSSLIYECCRLLNIIPQMSGVSAHLSPTSIVTGIPPPDFKAFRIGFGTYVQTHNNNSISNTPAARTSGAIALRPGLSPATWRFMSLVTGKQILRSKWTVLPTPDDVIARITTLAKSENQPEMTENANFSNPFVGSEGAHEENLNANNEDVISNENINEENQNNDENNADHEIDNVIDFEDNGNANDDENNLNENNNEFNNITDDEDDVIEHDDDDDNDNEKNLNNIDNYNINEEDETQKESLNDEATNHAEDDEQKDSFNEIFASNVQETEKQVGTRNQEEEADKRSGNEDVEESNGDDVFNPLVINEDTDDGDAETGGDKKIEQLRYNLRKRIRDTRDGAFNKKNYNFLTIYANKSKMRYSKRMKNEKDHMNSYRHALVRKLLGKTYNSEALQMGICLNQMSAKKGVKMYGSRAIDAMTKEYSQLDELEVFVPRWKNSLSEKEKKEALYTIDLIKEKRCGKIKGRTVVDGRAQRTTYKKEDTSSPALSIDSFIATLVIDAYEERSVAVCDISGAFLKANQPDHVIVKLTGHAVDAIVNANKEKYEKYVTEIKGVKVLYLQLLKAMYRTLTAALLWYQMFVDTIEEFGFAINPYDECVANRMVNGKQFTICWYVDDLKLSHAEENVVSDMINKLENKFGKMNVSNGLKHTYLGVDFELKDRKVYLRMEAYLTECIEAYGEAINTVATTPANKGLFEVNGNSKVLDTRRSKLFHHIVQKLLHVCKRTRLDLQVSIAFLCTRVREPNLQDWIKLKRVLQYIKGTISMSRVISLNNFEHMHIYTDGSHATHINMRGHTGGCIVMGDGVVHARSSKQGLNSKSSTETELIAVSDYLPYALWLIYFYEKQGYKIAKTVLEQDNQSTMKWLKNGRRSSGRQSRHINIRFFWIADRLKKHNIAVEFCSTHHMLGDFFTKPLQGSLFRVMRDIVQGLRPIEDLKQSKVSTDENSSEAICNEEEEKEIEDKELKGILLSSRKERVGKIEEKRIDKRVKFSDLDNNGKTRELNNKKATYADIAKRKIYA